MNTTEDKIEGMGDPQEGLWAGYPLDSLLIRNDHRTVYEVLRRIDRGGYIMDPEFQRDFIWSEKQQSKFIESVVMRIPLPVFYLAEDQEGRMVVVDGRQRLSTFRRFVNNEFKLNLKNRPGLHEKKFKDLCPKLQNRIEDCSLVLYIMDSSFPEPARLEIFDRVNSGVALSRQQMRNCLYMGEATKFLKAESKADIFRKATGESLQTGNMRDREFVNRFCAFQLTDIRKYRDMDEFLAGVLREMNKHPENLHILSSEFRTSLRNNHTLFGSHAFRKHVPNQENHNPINASLWDVMSTGLSRCSEDLVQNRANQLRERFFRLLGDDEFNNAITDSPNSVKKVRRRFEMATAMFAEVFGAHAA